MIYTVTFNPALDYIVSVPDFQMGRTNRSAGEQIFPGGKGVNVSIVLKNLGVESRALGFTAGFVGEEIRRRLKLSGVSEAFIPLESGCSRINFKWKESEGTEINGKGPEIPEKALAELLSRLDQLEKTDILVLAGSIPECLPETIYRDILHMLSSREISVVVDASGSLLTEVLPYHPFLIKPNHQELGDLFGVEVKSREEAVPYAEKLRAMGAWNVLVSMAGQGAVLADARGKIHMASAPEGVLVNGVGAGDSMVAGFLAGWIGRRDYAHAFRLGLAAGSASAFSENLATGAEVKKLYGQIKISSFPER